jgi:hypothetical protein
MKLRFRKNSLRLRVNQKEVELLASGALLEEHVHFPVGPTLSYLLQASTGSAAAATYCNGAIRVSTPMQQVTDWALSGEIGIYFDLPANGSVLKVAIEKDLECKDGPAEEIDPDAFPRGNKNC